MTFAKCAAAAHVGLAAVVLATCGLSIGGLVRSAGGSGSATTGATASATVAAPESESATATAAESRHAAQVVVLDSLGRPATARLAVTIHAVTINAVTINAVTITSDADAQNGPQVRALDVAEGGAAIEVPPGTRAVVRPSDPAAFVWPWRLEAEPGARLVFHAEPLSSLAVLLPDSLADDGAAPLRVIPAPALGTAAQAPPERAECLAADLLLRGISRPVVSRASPRIRGLLPVPHHIAGVVAGVPFFVEMPADADALDLRRVPPPRVLTREPLLGGAPLPSGGVVVPGRLDLVAVASLASIERRRLPGVVVVRGGGDWAPVAIAAADWYTLWHQDVGLGHARWAEGAALSATPGPGVIEFRTPPPPRGAVLEGEVALWNGDTRSRLFVKPPGAVVICRLQGAVSEIRGLPLGGYRYDGAFEFAEDQPAPAIAGGDGNDPANARHLRIRARLAAPFTYGSIELTATAPRAIVELRDTR